VSHSNTTASAGSNFSVDPPGDAVKSAGAISFNADNTTELAAKAWAGSYSSQGAGVGASIAAAISVDNYTASIGSNAALNASGLSVSATNEKVDNPLESIKL
jgi:hypothetical protein